MTKTRGQEAYELAASGLKWREVAERMGYKRSSLPHAAANRHAFRHGLKWPLRRSGQPCAEIAAKHARAYELAAEGAAWAEVAAAVGYSAPEGAFTAAEAHALRNDLRWPLGKQHRVSDAEVARMLDRLRGGEVMDALAADLGVVRQAISLLLRRRADPRALEEALAAGRAVRKAATAAKRAERDAPRRAAAEARRAKARARWARAYGLAEQGVSWTQIAEILDYAHQPSAVLAARKWAEVSGAPWPPVRESAREVA